MFKLIKIQNTGVNVPEPVKMSKNTSAKINIGTALILKNGIVQSAGATETPTHIALENAALEEKKILCYEIYPNMLFETKVNADPAALKAGDKVTLDFDSDSCAAYVTATTASGVATIAEINDVIEAGNNITVKF